MFNHFSSRLKASVTNFRRAEDGNTAIMFAVAFVPMVAFAGASIDLTRASREKSNLAHATDGAVLVVGKEMKTKTAQQLGETATKHLAAVNPAQNYVLNGAPEVNAAKTEVCINTYTDMPTAIMRIAGYDTVRLNSRACAKVGGTSYEIALSLDVTGSMADGDKIGSLKTAATNFINSVLPGGTQNNYVKVSIVPFSTGVKAFDPDSLAASGNSDEKTRYNANTWMDVTGASSIHWENFPKVTGGTFNPASRFELFANMSQKWGGCFEARPGTYALTDAAPNTATPDSLFVPLLAPDEGDSASNRWNNYLSDYGNSICVNSNTDPYKVRDGQSPYFSDGQSKLCKYKPGVQITTTTVPGACTTTQQTVQRWVCTRASAEPLTKFAGLGGSGGKLPTIADAFASNLTLAGRGNGNGGGRGNNDDDDDDDDDDDGGNGQTCGYQDVVEDVRTCEPDTYVNTETPKVLAVDTSNGKGPNRSCPTQVVMPLSNDSNALKTKISGLSTGGNTNIIEGVMWGWRTISPNGPYTGPKAYTQANHKKVLVLMTDGMNTWSTNSDNVNKSDYSPFGFFWNARLGSAGGTIGLPTTSNVRNFMDAKTLEACTNAKNAGVEVYTVAFSHPSWPIDTQGQTLLQNCASSSSKYFLATNATQLNLAFQNIGDSLDGLHISR